jgi:GTPase SAR1 family protein
MSKKSFGMQNFYEKKEVQCYNRKYHNPNYKHHQLNIPFRMLVIGASGSGKTNIIVNLLNYMSDTFNHIHLYTRCLDEPLYEYLRNSIDKEFLHCYEGLDHLNGISDLNTAFEGQNLIIFDDLVLESDQSKIEELFIRGRKLADGVSICYLSQSYYRIPKIIRLQANYIILRKIASARDLNMLLADSSLGVTKEVLQEIYKSCVKKTITDFLLIDLNVDPSKSFRKNFDTPILLGDEEL